MLYTLKLSMKRLSQTKTAVVTLPLQFLIIRYHIIRIYSTIARSLAYHLGALIPCALGPGVAVRQHLNWSHVRVKILLNTVKKTFNTHISTCSRITELNGSALLIA